MASPLRRRQGVRRAVPESEAQHTLEYAQGPPAAADRVVCAANNAFWLNDATAQRIRDPGAAPVMHPQRLYARSDPLILGDMRQWDADPRGSLTALKYLKSKHLISLGTPTCARHTVVLPKWASTSPSIEAHLRRTATAPRAAGRVSAAAAGRVSLGVLSSSETAPPLQTPVLPLPLMSEEQRRDYDADSVRRRRTAAYDDAKDRPTTAADAEEDEEASWTGRLRGGAHGGRAAVPPESSGGTFEMPEEALDREGYRNHRRGGPAWTTAADEDEDALRSLSPSDDSTSHLFLPAALAAAPASQWRRSEGRQEGAVLPPPRQAFPEAGAQGLAPWAAAVRNSHSLDRAASPPAVAPGGARRSRWP